MSVDQTRYERVLLGLKKIEVRILAVPLTLARRQMVIRGLGDGFLTTKRNPTYHRLFQLAVICCRDTEAIVKLPTKCRYNVFQLEIGQGVCRVRQVVKSSPFHGEVRDSNSLRGTKLRL